MVVVRHKEERGEKKSLAFREDEERKSLAFIDDKVYVSRKCEIQRLTIDLYVKLGLAA